MSELELIAKVGADYLEKNLGASVEEGTVARFLLDSLTGEQVAALCSEILSRPSLSQICQIRVPRKLVESLGVTEEILTDEKTTYWRHAPCDKPVLILANTDDEQGQSLRDISPIGSAELIAETELWVERAAEGTSLTSEQKKWWAKALRGLLQVKPQTLPFFSKYILKTKEGILSEGLPIALALGWALPALQVPRDSACFTSIPEKMLGRTDRWRRVYNFIFNNRAPYLVKLYPSSGQPIEREQLDQQWENLRSSNQIGTEHVEIFESFIPVPHQKWTPEVEALAGLEWNGDRVSALFEGLRKTERKKLGELRFSTHVGAQNREMPRKKESQIDFNHGPGGGTTSHQPPSPGEALKALSKRVTSYVLDDHFDTLVVGKTASLCCKIDFFVWDDFVSPNLTSLVEFGVGRRCCQDSGTPKLGNLNGGDSYTATRRLH